MIEIAVFLVEALIVAIAGAVFVGGSTLLIFLLTQKDKKALKNVKDPLQKGKAYRVLKKARRVA